MNLWEILRGFYYQVSSPNIGLNKIIWRLSQNSVVKMKLIKPQNSKSVFTEGAQSGIGSSEIVSFECPTVKGF
jgi:hypothetical protein